MKTARYDSRRDQITNFFESDNPLECQVDLCHSSDEGYYLARQVVQEWRGRAWETLTAEEYEELVEKMIEEQGMIKLPPGFRYLETFRPLERDALLRSLVDLAIPDHGALRSLFHKALDAAGIDSKK